MNKNKETQSRRKLWLLLLLCYPVSAVLLLLAQYAPGFAEWYATGPYAILSRGGNFLSGLFPFSIAELLVVICPILAIVWIAIQTIRIVRTKEGRGKNALGSALRLLCAGGIIFLLFTTNCGINYSCLLYTSDAADEL